MSYSAGLSSSYASGSTYVSLHSLTLWTLLNALTCSAAHSRTARYRQLLLMYRRAGDPIYPNAHPRFSTLHTAINPPLHSRLIVHPTLASHLAPTPLHRAKTKTKQHGSSRPSSLSGGYCSLPTFTWSGPCCRISPGWGIGCRLRICVSSLGVIASSRSFSAFPFPLRPMSDLRSGRAWIYRASLAWSCSRNWSLS